MFASRRQTPSRARAMATATLCPPCATMMREMREKLAPAVAARFDAARHWAGFVVLAGTFYVLPYWLSIHPLAALWRRLGRGFTLAFHASLVVALVANGARPEYREETMRWGGGDLGPPSGFALGVAAALFALSSYLRLAWTREMDLLTACGFRGELERGGREGRLRTSGVYAVVRHPRYAQILVRPGLTRPGPEAGARRSRVCLVQAQ